LTSNGCYCCWYHQCLPQTMGGGHAKTEKGKEERKESAAAVAWRRTCRDISRISQCGITCGVRVVHIAARILGPILLCVGAGLIGFVTYTGFFFILPLLEKEGLLVQISLSTTGMFLVFNIVYNYARSAFTDPGQPPEYEKGMVELRSQVEQLGQMKQCKKCHRLKPPRCHHCSICNRCVLKMDHHCPWINNCVGWRNYRFFCLFMLYLCFGCCFVIFVCVMFFQDMVIGRHRRRSMAERLVRTRILMAFTVCCSILVALILLGGFHVYLVLSNQTTIEFQTNFIKRAEARKNGEYFRNPYDLGRTRNFQQVFGPYLPRRLCWLLSWLTQPPSGDGIIFPSLSRLSV